MPSNRTSDDVRKKLAKAKTLAEAIGILVAAAGSDDKLGDQLGTSRQTVIGWRKHGRFPEEYIDKLRDLGVPDNLLRRVTREEVERRLRQVEAEVEELRRLL